MHIVVRGNRLKSIMYSLVPIQKRSIFIINAHLTYTIGTNSQQFKYTIVTLYRNILL